MRPGRGETEVDMQALAIMEDEDGRSEQARTLFHRASLADPHHVPVWQVCSLHHPPPYCVCLR